MPTPAKEVWHNLTPQVRQDIAEVIFASTTCVLLTDAKWISPRSSPIINMPIRRP